MNSAIRLLTGTVLLCSATSASADLVASPSPIDFQYQRVHVTSPPMATTLSNTGNQSLTVTAVSPATGVYARAGGSCGAPPFAIAAQSDCTIEYTFRPDWVQAFYQTISLTLAVGTSNGFTLRGEGAEGILRLDPLWTLNWWNPIPVGTVGEEKLVQVNNDGPVPLTITEISESSVPPVSAFVRTGGTCPTPPFELGTQCAIFYTFVPAQVGQSTMELEVRAGSLPYRSLSLEGYGSAEISLFKDGFDENALAPTP